MAFFTVYKPPKVMPSVSGEKDRQNYHVAPLDGDAYELVPYGKIHSYDEIQSHANECDFEKIIDMYNQTGDSSILQRRAAFYDEEGSLPSDYRELVARISRADELFKGLPSDVRNQFGNSASVFYSNPSNMAIIEGYYKQKATVKPTTPIPTAENPTVVSPKGDESN